MTPWPVDVGPLGMGCAALGNLYSPVDEDEALAAVEVAWARGVRFFDTAPLYGHGLSELRLGAALAGRPRDAYVLSTKVGRLLVPRAEGAPAAQSIFADVPPVEPVFDFTADGVRRSIDASLGRLGVDRLDVVHVHDPEEHLDTAVAEAYPALLALRDEGVIGAVGLGTNQASTGMHVTERVDVDCILLAGRCTLLDRSGTDALLPRCDERDIAVIAAGVFNSGLLADPRPGAHFHYEPAPDEVIDQAIALAARCEAHGVPLAAVALQFPFRHPGVALVLAGPRRAVEVDEDVDLLAVDIPEQLWRELGA